MSSLPIKYYFKLFRIPNVLMVLFINSILYLRFRSDDHLIYWFLIYISSICLATIGGYIINDLFDKDLDKINHDKNVLNTGAITISTAKILYVTCFVLSTILSFFVNTYFGCIVLIVNFLLFLYSYRLKLMFLFGNVCIAFLTTASFACLVFIISVDNKLLIYLSLFSFVLTLFRELVKDVEDIEGDQLNGCNTIPIVMGINTSKRIAIFYILLLVVCSYFLYFVSGIEFIHNALLGILQIFLFLVLGLLTLQANQKVHFSRLSRYAKILMFIGMVFFMLT